MRFFIGDLEVLFPYDYIYKEQYAYMVELKRTLDAGGHCLLEMPTGTGKTVAILALVTSYQASRPETGRLVYCTRTVPEMEKVLEELDRVVEYRVKELGPDAGKILGIGLSTRRNLCVHPRVSQESERATVDAQCRAMVASWVRERAIEDSGDVELCDFYEGFDRAGTEAVLPSGVYTLEAMREFARNQGWCPYYLARHMIAFANIIVYNYQYLIDPKISKMVSKELGRESIVVFDEAHNIDNVCIEVLSIDLNRRILEDASHNLQKLSQTISTMKQKDAHSLNEEYQQLVEGLRSTGAVRGGEEFADGTSYLPDELLNEAMPGNIRRAEHFVGLLKRLVEFLRGRLRIQRVMQETPLVFLQNLSHTVEIEARPLKFCAERLATLLRTLEVTDLSEFRSLTMVTDFATLVATHTGGFVVLMEPFDDRVAHLYDPVLQLSCLDASIAMKPVFERFQSVIITSGTLSPLDLYPRILNFHPVTIQAFPMSLTRSCICPVIVTRGSDQVAVSSKYDLRNDPAVVRNFGSLVVEFAAVVPDGIVCYFTSYEYMEQIISLWHEMGLINQLLSRKLLFVETPDVVETTLALERYREACDSGRGAVFFSVARGKVAEGIDFDRQYGRCVILFGVPYMYTESRILRARLEFLRDRHQIRENDFLAFDAMRQAAQCVGRVIRGKNDYGIMVFADKRYARADKRGKLPQWINQFLPDSQLNLSTDMACTVARNFLQQMAQPVSKDEAMGKVYLTESNLVKSTGKRKAS